MAMVLDSVAGLFHHPFSLSAALTLKGNEMTWPHIKFATLQIARLAIPLALHK
jgi:hypothetical protein